MHRLARKYNELRVQSDPRVTIDGEELRPAEVADPYIQGAIFHGDAAKERRLREITQDDPIRGPVIQDGALYFANQVFQMSYWLASLIRQEGAAGRLR